MGVRARALGGMSVVIGAPVGAIVLLHGPAGAGWARVDWADPLGWLDTVSLETALVALARLVALTASYALVATSVAHLAAVATGHGRLVRLTGRIAAPLVRRLVDRIVAGSVAMSVIAGPALAAPVPHPPLPAVDSIEHRAEGVIDPLAPLVPEGYAPDAYRVEPAEEPGSLPAEAESPPDGRPAPPPAPTPPPSGPSTAEPQPDAAAPHSSGPGTITVTVRPGDSIWKLAAHRLRDHLGRPVGDPEVAPYWRAAVDANAGSLRSGDPDLIFPGERIALPDPADFSRVGS